MNLLVIDELQYANEWIANPHGRPLSLSLPFTPDNKPIKGDKVSFYFDNLPPGDFPNSLSDNIFEGMKTQAAKLRA